LREGGPRGKKGELGIYQDGGRQKATVPYPKAAPKSWLTSQKKGKKSKKKPNNMVRQPDENHFLMPILGELLQKRTLKEGLGKKRQRKKKKTRRWEPTL